MARPDPKAERQRSSVESNRVLQRLKQLVTSAKKMTGQDIKNIRSALGLSQAKFAKALKVSRMMIYRAERGVPSRALIAYIERALVDGSLKVSERKLEPETPSEF